MIHMRQYNDFENKNISFLVKKQIEFSTIQITQIGLAKSTLDATAPVRAYFQSKGLHDYSIQKQGQENKVFVTTYILTETSLFKTMTSLYRPVTKKGDPRLWIYSLQPYVRANDIFALIVFDKKLFIINLTLTNIEKICTCTVRTPLKEFVEDVSKIKSSISDELLALIKSKISGWKRSEITADTGVGRTIESFLGISMNSSKLPDYKGIELKSKREKSSERSVLFTQVPNWELSKLKSSKAIAEKYGYFDEKSRHKTLQVTVQAQKTNRQNLALDIDYLKNCLELIEANQNENLIQKTDDAAVWLLEKLHSRLLEKHKETFWIDVETMNRNGAEYFKINSIEHTKNPIAPQFDLLLEQGKIQLDLLLSRPDGHGDVFAFKIKKNDRKYLFPESETFKID